MNSLAILLLGAAPAHAADWGLTLFVLNEPPLSATPGPASYTPGGRATARLIFENRGGHALNKIRVTVEFVGAAPVVEKFGSWKREGDGIRTTIDTIGPGDSIELPLVVELADGTERGARGTGGEARIRASVPATGETLLAEASWPIASCADAYHTALRLVRYGEFAALRAAAEAAAKPDAALPGATVFALSAGIGRDAVAAARFAEEIAARQGLDDYYTTEDMRWLSGRLINDISVYLGQDRYPGLCTGVAAWTGILQEYTGRFSKRVDEIAALRGRLEAAARPLVAAAREDDGQSPQDTAYEAQAAAAALLLVTGSTGQAAIQGAAVFEAARGSIDSAGEALAPERRKALVNAFGALERLWYIELAESRAAAVADGFSATIEAIRTAQKRTCTCDQ